MHKVSNSKVIIGYIGNHLDNAMGPNREHITPEDLKTLSDDKFGNEFVVVYQWQEQPGSPIILLNLATACSQSNNRKLLMLRAKYNMRPDWHEPDEQGISAKISGNRVHIFHDNGNKKKKVLTIKFDEIFLRKR